MSHCNQLGTLLLVYSSIRMQTAEYNTIRSIFQHFFSFVQQLCKVCSLITEASSTRANHCHDA